MTTDKHNPDIHIENIQPILSVKDMNISRAFYVEILGFKEADWGDDNFTSISRDDCGVYLCKGEQGNPGTWIWVGFDGDIFSYTMNSGKRNSHSSASYQSFLGNGNADRRSRWSRFKIRNRSR